MERFEVIIVGAGPAGLSAALLLGRCRRKTLVLDDGRPRNAASHALHGFLTRDGVSPETIRRIGRSELSTYESVSFLRDEVIEAVRVPDGFILRTSSGDAYRGRMLLLATGVVDPLPEVAGIEAFYGTSVFHCPYCDGWEQRDRRLAALGANAVGLALELKQWSEDVVLLSNGVRVADHARRKLRSVGISICIAPLVRLEGEEGVLRRIHFEDGGALERDAIFFKTAARQRSDLARTLGCEMTEDGLVKTGRFEITRVPGLFVAGDATRNVHLAIVAAAEGAEAAFAINTALMKSDLAVASRATHRRTRQRTRQETSS